MKQTEIWTRVIHVNSWEQQLNRLHELHESKFPFVSGIKFICSKLSNFSDHVFGASDAPRPPIDPHVNGSVIRYPARMIQTERSGHAPCRHTSAAGSGVNGTGQESCTERPGRGIGGLGHDIGQGSGIRGSGIGTGVRGAE